MANPTDLAGSSRRQCPLFPVFFIVLHLTLGRKCGTHLLCSGVKNVSLVCLNLHKLCFLLPFFFFRRVCNIAKSVY